MRVVTQRSQPDVDGEEEPEPGELSQIFSYCLRVVEDDEEEGIPEPRPRRRMWAPPPPTPWRRRHEPRNHTSISTLELDNRTGTMPGEWPTGVPRNHSRRQRARLSLPPIRIPTQQEIAERTGDRPGDVIIVSDDSDSGLSIVDPIRNTISSTRETRTDEATYGSHSRSMRPCPDSGIHPNRHEFWNFEAPGKGKGRADNLRPAREQVMPVGTKVDVWLGKKEEDEWKHGVEYRHEGRNGEGSRPNRDGEPRVDTRRASGTWIADLDRLVNSSPTEIEEPHVPEDEPVIPKRPVRRKPRKVNLRKERRKQQQESSKTMTTPEREKSGSAIRIAWHAASTSQLNRQSGPRRRVGRPRKLVANPRTSPNLVERATCETPEDISTGQPSTNTTHLPSWLQKLHQFLESLATLSNLERLLLLLLAISALANYLRFSRLQMTHLSTASPRQALGSEGRSSREPHPQEHPTDRLDTRTADNIDQETHPDRANQEDVPKAIMDALYAPSANHMTPGIVAMSHVVPLAVESSHLIREYLGKATTVSFRLGSGRAVQYRADVHLRIYDRGTNLGWKNVDLPSRKDVELLRSILFREHGYEKVMDWLRVEARRVPPFPSMTTGGGDVEKIIEGSKEGLSKEEERVGQFPLDAMAHNTKIGPPAVRKPGALGCESLEKVWRTDLRVTGKGTQRARRSKPFDSQPSYDDKRVDKMEEDEDAYRQALATHPNGSAQSSSHRTTSKSSSLPELAYPDPRDDTMMADEPAGAQAKAGNPYQHPDSTDRLNEHTSRDITTVRSSREILPDIVQLLYRLRWELGIAMDRETRELSERIERQSWRMMGEREYQAVREEERDGDVEMEKEDGYERKDPVPAYTPASLEVEPEEKEPKEKSSLELRIEELEEKVHEGEKEVRENEWRAAGDRSRFDERMSSIEARLAVLEARPMEEEDPWVKVKSPRGRQGREGSQPVARSLVSRVEEKADTTAQEVVGIQSRVESIEEAIKGIEEVTLGAKLHLSRGYMVIKW